MGLQKFGLERGFGKLYGFCKKKRIISKIKIAMILFTCYRYTYWYFDFLSMFSDRSKT